MSCVLARLQICLKNGAQGRFYWLFLKTTAKSNVDKKKSGGGLLFAKLAINQKSAMIKISGRVPVLPLKWVSDEIDMNIYSIMVHVPQWLNGASARIAELPLKS
jgi:hypothetical protein